MQGEKPVKKQQNRRLGGLFALLALTIIFGGSLLAWNKWNTSKQLAARNLPTKDLEARAKQQPKSAEAHYALALAYIKDSRTNEAINSFLAALDQEPTRHDILNDLGVTYLLLGRYYESLVALQGALSSNPNYAPAYANMGRLHIATKMPFTAVKELEKARQLEPKNIGTACDLGQAYQRTLNFKSAEDAYQRALALDPNSTQAMLGLGQVWYATTKYDNALEMLNKLAVKVPDDPAVHLALGRLYFERATGKNDFEQARKHFEQTVRLDQNDPEAWYQLGRVELKDGKNARALEMQRRALRIAPQHSGALYQLERCLRAVGRIADADRLAKTHQDRVLRERQELQLEEKISHSPDDWDARAQLAELYLTSGKTALATLLIKKIQQEKPDHPKLPQFLQILNPPSSKPIPTNLLQGGN
jgi:tetratricopeptide (TPR) repeat protein